MVARGGVCLVWVLVVVVSLLWLLLLLWLVLWLLLLVLVAVVVVIHRLEPWKTLAAVAWETLKWVDWFNNCRLLAPIGYIPPSEAEEGYYAQCNTLDMVA